MASCKGEPRMTISFYWTPKHSTREQWLSGLLDIRGVGLNKKMTNESKGPRTKMLLVYVGATDSSDQPKIKYTDNKLQG